MLDATQWMGGVHGVGGTLTFPALEHMLDAMQRMAWGGVVGMLTIFALAHMLEWMGWDVP